jgi:hypothetical protein
MRRNAPFPGQPSLFSLFALRVVAASRSVFTGTWRGLFVVSHGHQYAVKRLVVYPKKTGRWGYKIGDRFGPRTYPTNNEAKLALFDDFWMATQDDEQLWSSD